MLFCPFCGKPIVIPEQDDGPAEAVAAAPSEIGQEKASVESVQAADGGETPVEAESIPTSVLEDENGRDALGQAESLDDAAAELLDWNRKRRSHLEADVWARPEAPAGDFTPLALDDPGEKLEESDWKDEIIRKKQSVTLEKKPPEIKRSEDKTVRLEGSAPKLDQDAQGVKPRTREPNRRKPANTLVPPKTMDPEDIFMDDKRAPYDEEDPYDYDGREEDLKGHFDFEDDDEGSFFMRHLRGIVGLALFAILLLMFVIYAFSKPGQLSLARINAAWSKDAYSTLGFEYYQAGNYSQAGLYYERALQRDPTSYSFASSAAMAYLEAGDNERATAMLKRCAEIDPAKLEPYAYLLKLYPDAASRPWDITQLLQQGYQRTGDTRLNVTG
jgi:tetratricopeptide (TPR) repeat protein